MTPSESMRNRGPGGSAGFATTHWSIVLAAGQHASPDSGQALAILCETYWYPLYAYTRRRGYGTEDAQDLIQEFFTRLLEKNDFRIADPQRGKFRSFLLASLNHFLAKEWRRTRAAKRGGGRPHLSLDFLMGESRYSREPWHEWTPEKVYLRRWALTLLDQAIANLQAEYTASGKRELFEHLKAFVGGDKSSVPYQEIAVRLGMSEGAVKVAVHRLRRRCSQIVRTEIAQTVADPDEVAQELRTLFDAIAS